MAMAGTMSPQSMKNGSGSKGSSLKTPSTSSGGGSRKSRWEAEDKSPAHRLAPLPFRSHQTQSASHLRLAPPRTALSHPRSLPLSPPVDPATSLTLTTPSPRSPPSYGFHNLERRTIVLANGSVRSYFALSPDDPIDDKFLYDRPGFGHGLEPLPRLGFDKHLAPPSEVGLSPEDFHQTPSFGRGPGPQRDYWDSLGLDDPRGLPEGGVGPSSLKRKYGVEEEFLRHRHHPMHAGNPSGTPIRPSGSGEDRRDFFRSSPSGWDHHDALRSSCP